MIINIDFPISVSQTIKLEKTATAPCKMNLKSTNKVKQLNVNRSTDINITDKILNISSSPIHYSALTFLRSKYL